MIKFIKPELTHKKDVLKLKDIFINNNESFAGGSSLLRLENYEEWISVIDNPNLSIEKGLTPFSVFLVVNEEELIVAIVDIRHNIDHPVLASVGGHIGYSVNPKYRNKGYGSKILAEAILVSNKLGINELLLTCKEDNIFSKKIIIKNGGVFEKKVYSDDGVYERYFIK